MARNWKKLEQIGIKRPIVKKKASKILWFFVSVVSLAIIAIITAVWISKSIANPSNTKSFSDPNNTFTIDIPNDWKVPDKQKVLEFSAGLDLGDFAYLFVQNDFDINASAENINVLTIAAFSKSPKSSKNLEQFTWRIGGMTADPYKYLTQEIKKEGKKILNVDGYYTFKFGFPVGIFNNNDYTFIIHGNIADKKGQQLLEKMINSIR